MTEPRLGSAVLVINGKNEVLLGRRAKDPGRGQWVIPGGKIQYRETITEAGIREIKEETGLDVVLQNERLGVYEMIDAQQHRVIVYSIGFPVGIVDIVPGSDISEARFFSDDEIAALPESELSGWMFGVLIDARRKHWID